MARRRITPALLIVALMLLLAALVVVILINRRPPPPPPALPASTWPNRALTPGAVDPGATDSNICAHDWQAGVPPRPGGGNLTYSKAARRTSARLKDAVFAAYGLRNPHDGGRAWEVDHLIPLALGGSDVRENLWPESRRGDGLNAFAKDRLEYRLYRMVCHPAPGTAPLPLRSAQAAFTPDWVAGYKTYCANAADCPEFGRD